MTLMKKLTEFVSKHISDDTTRLILDKAKWPDIDMEIAVNCIESRRKLRGKVNEWYEDSRLIFPLKLSAEQCSSSATALYKASVAAKIGKSLADLTGGLGVDSWFFSQKLEHVLYNEMQEKLFNATEYNFRTLDATNITTNCGTAEKGNICNILGNFRPEIIFMDPARRGEGGRKVFLIEECTPDVLSLKDELFSYCRHILLKLSPMADISMVCERLGRTCREVHVVAAGGECKELLIWMDKEWDDDYSITAAELPGSYPDKPEATFTFKLSDERSCIPETADLESLTCNITDNMFLFEPGKAMMKAGCFNLMSSHFGIGKLGRSTHYYIVLSDDYAEPLTDLGKVFRIKRIDHLDKKSIKALGNEFPNADVSARNIPMTSEMLAKRIGCGPGNGIHIFGLKSDTEGSILITAERTSKPLSI